MKILGNRILVKRLPKVEKEGAFKEVEVEDNFIYKGEIVQMGDVERYHTFTKPGQVVVFAKYSPDTQEIDVDGETMKIVLMDDVLAIID